VLSLEFISLYLGMATQNTVDCNLDVSLRSRFSERKSQVEPSSYRAVEEWSTKMRRIERNINELIIECLTRIQSKASHSEYDAEQMQCMSICQ
jgi:hypothetical protein